MTKHKAGTMRNSARWMIRNAIVLLLLVLAGLWTACSESSERAVGEPLLVPGTGACERVLGLLAQAFRKTHFEIEVIIPPSTGTSGGIQSVVSGITPLGRVGRPLKDDERAKGLVFEAFANDIVVFAVGEAVQIDGLTTEQLTAVFKGEITNWRELGLQEAPIRVVGRQPGEASLDAIAKKIETFRDIVFGQGAKIVYHDGEMVDLLNKHPTSIGFLPKSLVTAPGNKMKAIALNGVAPTIENGISGKYPFVTVSGFIYKKGNLSGLAKDFVDFVFSDVGRQVITNAGMAPVARR